MLRSLIESLDAVQVVVRGLLDDLGNGRVPGFAASSPDGDDAVQQVGRRDLLFHEAADDDETAAVEPRPQR